MMPKISVLMLLVEASLIGLTSTILEALARLRERTGRGHRLDAGQILVTSGKEEGSIPSRMRSLDCGRRRASTRAAAEPAAQNTAMALPRKPLLGVATSGLMALDLSFLRCLESGRRRRMLQRTKGQRSIARDAWPTKESLSNRQSVSGRVARMRYLKARDRRWRLCPDMVKPELTRMRLLASWKSATIGNDEARSGT